MTTFLRDKPRPQTCRSRLSPYQTELKPRSVGRPFFDGKDERSVIAKLEYAFSLDATVKECCLHAEISTDSLYRYFKKYPEFRNRLEALRNNPILKARETVVRALATEPRIAMWYLERQRPAEFSRNEALSAQLREAVERIEYLERILLARGTEFTE